MVEISEETADEQPTSGENHQQSGQTNGTTAGSGIQRKSPMDFIKENPNEMLSFGLRLATIYFAISYFLPIATPLQKMAYTKAFAAAAATNAFRLHQRLSTWSRTENVPVFSQRFLLELMIEDSAHYFFYCVILVMSSPITLALLPISLYAIFNIINFVSKFSNEVGYISPSIANSIYQIKQQHSASMLCTIACAEIFLFPILVIMIFFGKANLFTPFVYYRFLTMRYLSRRNPYTREMFIQLKYLFQSVANKPACPLFLKTVIFKSISIIERLAPQQIPM